MIATLITGCAAACNSPTTPTAGASQSMSSVETFAVTGIVTDVRDAPVPGAWITMRYYVGGMIRQALVETDASGSYAVQFTSTPFSMSDGRSAARAEVLADGFDWYWRNVPATSPRVENFRLRRITHIQAGGSGVVSVTTDNGTCQGWLHGPCGRARVTVPANGNLTVEAVPTQQGADLPALEVCCVGGDEVQGNPITIPVLAGKEVWVELGQNRPGGIPSATVEVKTSFEHFDPFDSQPFLRHSWFGHDHDRTGTTSVFGYASASRAL
jgi:hypothetical protein